MCVDQSPKRGLKYQLDNYVKYSKYVNCGIVAWDNSQNCVTNLDSLGQVYKTLNEVRCIVDLIWEL